METWKPIRGYEGLYSVSSLGRIKSLAKPLSNGRSANEMILKLQTNKGYHSIKLWKNDKPVRLQVHRVVALNFLSPIPGKYSVNHKNGIKNDNRVENLEWCNVSENTKHAYDNGLIPSRVGANNPNHRSRKTREVKP